jgi:hypothetical protein
LSYVLHDNHGADPEDVVEAKVHNAVSRLIVSAWRNREMTMVKIRGNKIRVLRGKEFKN